MKNKLANCIYQYKLKPEVTKKENITHNKVITKNTLEVFRILHSDFDNVYIKSIKSPLQILYKSDEVITFENINIYYHTYRILFWIYQYVSIIDFYQSNDYKKSSFAKCKSTKNKFKREYKKNRKELFDKANAYTGDNRTHAFTLRKYLIHRNLMDIYFNATTLFSKNNINYDFLKEIENVDTTTINVVQKIHTYYSSSYIDSEDVICESLAIIVNGYLRLKMGINSKISHRVTNELLYELFHYKINKTSSDRLSNIYIAGRINNFPIFKNAKNIDIYSQEDKKKFSDLLEEAKQDFSDSDNLLLDADIYFISNPLKAFFEQYPMEFLSKIE